MIWALEVALLLLLQDQPRKGPEHAKMSYWLWKCAETGARNDKNVKSADFLRQLTQLWDDLSPGGCFVVATSGPTQGRSWACKNVILTMEMCRNGDQKWQKRKICWLLMSAYAALRWFEPWRLLCFCYFRANPGKVLSMQKCHIDYGNVPKRGPELTKM